MGNHEYCASCGQSDFHYGQTCQEAYPKEYREHQRKKRRLEAEQERGRKALRRLAKKIEATFGCKTEIETFDGKDSYIRIHFWEALKAEEIAARTNQLADLEEGQVIHVCDGTGVGSG